MKVSRLRMTALAFACLCAVSFPALAQTGNAQAPSLGDLGFPTGQTKGSAEEQAKLDKRSHMLKIHQQLGLITAAPLLATIITSSRASGRRSSTSGRELHAGLGIATAGMYFTTAYYAIAPPRCREPSPAGPPAGTRPWLGFMAPE